MSSLAESSRGIPIPVEEIRSALESAAIPGFTGSVQIVIGLKPGAAEYVTFAVVRRQSKRTTDQASTQVLPDPERKKPVQNVLRAVTEKLMIRTVISALEVHVVDGKLQENFLVQD